MKSNYIKFYYEDFLNSPDVQMMDTCQIGAYCLLLFNSLEQKEKGYLPINEEHLKEITRMGNNQWNNNKEAVLKKFSVSEKGYYNKKMIQVLGEDKSQEQLIEMPRYHKIQEYVVKHFKNIQKMQNQLTYEQCVLLTEKFKPDIIKKKLKKMENIPDLSKRYASVFLTLESWCEADVKKINIHV